MIIQLVGSTGEPLPEHTVVVHAASAPSLEETALKTDARGRVNVNLAAEASFHLVIIAPGGVPLGSTRELTTPDSPDFRQVTMKLLR